MLDPSRWNSAMRARCLSCKREWEREVGEGVTVGGRERGAGREMEVEIEGGRGSKRGRERERER